MARETTPSFFGKEKTPGQALTRAAWEREQAAQIRAAKRPIGWEHLVEAHEKTARDYDWLANKLESESRPVGSARGLLATKAQRERRK